MKLVSCEFLALAALLLTSQIGIAADVPESNRFPRIATGCVKPTVTTKETVPIRFSVADWNNSRVSLGDNSHRFDIHIRCVCPDGKVRERTLKNVPSGSAEMELRSQPKGEYYFCVWAVGEKGRESHRAWHRFRVVESDEQDVPSDAVAKITSEDLVKYAITTNCADRLVLLLADKAKEGFRKVEIPKGDYIISSSVSVSIPEGMTLDLNGSTLRRKRGDSAIVVIDGVRDAHLVNGTLDGGYFEFLSDAMYCSVEGVAVTNVAGVKVVGKTARSKQMWYDPIPVSSSNDLVGLKGAMKSGWVQLSLRDAACVRSSDDLRKRGQWYDAKKKLLSSETLFVNRLVPIPAKAAYLRVEGGEGMSLVHYRIPQNCIVRNCTFLGCGDFMYNAGTTRNMRFEGNVFESCVFRVDCGWDLMQDVAFERNRYGDSIKVIGSGSVSAAEFADVKVSAANMTACSLFKCEVDGLSDGVWTGVKMDGGKVLLHNQTNAFVRCRFKGVEFAMNMARGERTFRECTFEGCRFWGVNGGSLRFEGCRFRGGDISAGALSVHDSATKLVFTGCTFDVLGKSYLKVGAHVIGSVLIDKCKVDDTSLTCKQFIDIFDLRSPKESSVPGMVVVIDSEFGSGIPAIVGCSTVLDGAYLKPDEKPRKIEFTFSRNKLTDAAVERTSFPLTEQR